jgi:hypothetical protein
MGIAQLGDLQLFLESPEQRNVVPPFGGNDQQRMPDDSNPCGANGRKRIHATRISQILKTHQYLSEPQNLIFWDGNIAGDMEYAKALFRAIAPYRKWWSSQASIHAGRDDEFLEAAAHSGCIQLFLGLESISQQSMAEMNKGFNRVEEYFQIIERIHSHGIAVQAGIIFGFDNDTPEILKDTLDFLEEAGVQNATFNILTPFPGTALFRKMEAEGRILTQDWRKHNSRGDASPRRQGVSFQARHSFTPALARPQVLGFVARSDSLTR